MISFQQLIEKTLTPAEKKKREEIAKAMEKDNPDMPMGKKMAIATATAKRVAESDFEPHMMYDPKTGKGYKANKPEDHVRMKKMGYTHEKPELKENYRTSVVELDESAALLTFLIVNGVLTTALVGSIGAAMIADMNGIDLDDKLEKGWEKLKSKFKRNKKYKPSKAEQETIKKIGQEVKKKDPKSYNKAIQQVDKIKTNESLAKNFFKLKNFFAENMMEETNINENYRTLARKGMGTETKGQVKVGQEMDFYETERGDKVFGKVIKVSSTGYIVQAMERGNNKKYSFRYHDRAKAKKLLSMNEDGQYVSPSKMTDKQKADLKAKQQAERERRMRQMKMGQKDSEEERARKQRERERRLKQYAGKRESVNETVNYHTKISNINIANAMKNNRMLKKYVNVVPGSGTSDTYEIASLLSKKMKKFGFDKKEVKAIEDVMQTAFATNEAFKPTMIKDYPRIVDFYIQFRGGKGDRITSPDNKKDYEKALKLTQAFMRKNKIQSKLETGTPEQGSSAYKISLILNSKKPEFRVDLRPLVNQIAKLKTAEDHGGGYDKPLKEGNLQELSLDHNMLQRQFPNVWATKDAKLYRVLSHLIRQDGYNDPKKAYDKDKKKFVDTLRDIAKNPKKYEKSFGRGFSQYIDNPKKGQAFSEGKSFSEIMEVSQQAQIRKAIDIATSMGGNMTGAVKRIEAIKKGLSKNKNVANALRLANEEMVVEVTDVEINLMKQLSKDAVKLKKNYSLIVKAGDKELKNRKYNKEWKAILDMQQAVLSLIGKLQTQKIIDDGKTRKESLEEKLSKTDLKFMSMMYDKKGKLTDVGKAVMNYKPGDNIRKIVQNLNNKKEAVSPAQQAAIAISKKEKGEKPIKESRARRDAMRGMRADPDFQPKDFKDIRATDADRKAASKNVLMQIRKATDLPKGGEIEFPSGKKGKISQADAKKVDKMFNVLKKPQDKAKFQKVISKDLNSIKGLLKRLGR
jgi:hypothetical protein